MGVSLTTHLIRVDGESVVDLSALSPGARFVLLIYCEHADNRTHHAFPGTPRIQRLTGFSDRNVQRYVQELRNAGLLELVENRGGRRNFATYRVVLPGLAAPMAPETAAALGQLTGQQPTRKLPSR